MTAQAQQIQSTAAPSLPDHLPHDIHGLVEYPFSLFSQTWFWLLVLAALAFAAIWWWKARRRTGPKPQPIEDPLVVLMRRLDGIEPETPFHGPDYFYELGLVLREVIEATTSIAATDSTLKELRQPLKKHLPLSREAKAGMLAFFERADLIKFADAPTSLEEAKNCYEEAREWSRKLINEYRIRQSASSEQVPSPDTAQTEGSV